MVVTTRERRDGENMREKARTGESCRRRFVFKTYDHGKRDLFVLQKSDDMPLITPLVTSQHDVDAFKGLHTGNETSMVKKRAPTPWRPVVGESETSESDDVTDSGFITSQFNDYSAVRTESFIEESYADDYFVTPQFHGYADPAIAEARKLYEACDVRNGQQYVTSRSCQASREVATSTCCQGLNNHSFETNSQHNGVNPFLSGMGIVREKTIMSTTIAYPRTPLRKKKFDTEDGFADNTQRNLISGCNFPTLRGFDLPLQCFDRDNYVKSSDYEASSSASEPDTSSPTYPSSPTSIQDSLDEEKGDFTEIYMISEEQPVQVFSSERKLRNFDTEPSRSAAKRAMLINKGKRELISKKTGKSLDQKDKTQTKHDLGVNENDSAVKTDANILPTSEDSPSDLPDSQDRDFGVHSPEETGSQCGRSSVLSPSSESAPPSAMKKRGSLSRSESGKKQKVQFDMDIEVHFVPRDSYESQSANVNGDVIDANGYDDYDEDRYSEYSNDVDAEDDITINSREFSHPYEMNGAPRLHGPAVPFRVIRRETPTGGSRRGRRDSYDLMQKAMNKQVRDRATYNQKLAVTDHERRYPRPPRRGPSPPRTPHSSYYHTREYRHRQTEDPRMQTRANSMSPEHFVAFYTRQQQLKQYLDHERRMRRQQMLSGNMKYKEPIHKHDSTASTGQQDGANFADENESGSDSGASLDDRLPKVSTRDGSSLPQPRPYVQRGSASGRRKGNHNDEQSRISSGYGGSGSESEISSAGLRRDYTNDVTTLPVMTSCHSRQPFTQRQVAEVMRASGMSKGNMAYVNDNKRYHGNDDVRNMTSSRQRQRDHESTRDNPSVGASTFAKLSLKAKKALQQAHLAYTSSLNEMMPAVKSFPDASEKGRGGKDLSPRMGPVLSLDESQLHSNYQADGNQPFVRYLHSNTRGKIPETFARQQHSYTLPGNRIGSAQIPSNLPNTNLISGSAHRPGTSEAVTVNMLGLSARLPLNARRSAQGHKSLQLAKPLQPVPRPNADPYRRMTSGNKSPYLRSQLPDDWSKTLQHSFSQNDASNYRPFFNHESTNSGRRKLRHQNSDLLRSRPPQLRGTHFSYSGSQSADYSKPPVPPKILA